MEVLCDSVGAKLISADITRGLFDFCVIVEAVDYKGIRGIAKGVKYTPPKG